MTLTAWLPGRGRWLMMPSTLGNALVALLASQYAAATFQFKGSLSGVFWLAVVGIAAVGVGLSELIASRRLASLRGLASGRLPVSERTLLSAIDEARRFPDVVARLGAFGWLGAVTALAVVLSLLGGFPTSVIVRLVLLGVAFGPMAAVTVGLWVGRRSHVVVERLSEGLSPDAVVASLAVPSSSIGTRLVAFTLVMVGVPSLVSIDVDRALGDALIEAWLTQDAAGRAALEARAGQELVATCLAFIAAAALMAAAAAFVGGSLVAEPLQRVANEASALARGQVGAARLIPGDGEVWLISNVFSRLKERLVRLVARLSSAAARITEAALALRQASSASEASAAQQAAALNQTSATTSALAQSARHIAASASRVQELARQTLDAAEAGSATAVAFRAAIDRMRDDNRAIAEAVEQLSSRMQQIGRIVDVIDGVADRSELLALSAELEGTRAGEVGKGFALVAGEMRRLAENVLESTAEVEELIAEIRAATRQTAEATAKARALTEGGTALADEVSLALTAVARGARQTADAARTIGLATQQQESGTDQLADAMADILGITQQTVGSTRQLAEADERLETQSTALAEVVRRFRARA
ncbi:MAG: methyl-accepting chemotaxis protein [Myxococcaceae bacterium]|nr:methyl-accepting chemotaxis protein [Myxococcaceae bacterium]